MVPSRVKGPSKDAVRPMGAPYVMIAESGDHINRPLAAKRQARGRKTREWQVETEKSSKGFLDGNRGLGYNLRRRLKVRFQEV